MRRLTLVSLAGLMVACDSGADRADTSEMQRGTPVAITPAPFLILGVVEGDDRQEFDRVVSPFLLPDGSLVVPVAGAGTIHVFDVQGSFIRSLGQPGAGPGEFRRLQRAWSRGDTIEAFDTDLHRVTRFLPDSGVEVVDLRSGVRDLSAIAGPVEDGWIAGGVALGGAGRRDSLVLRWFDRSGTDRGAVASVEGFARYQTPFLTGPEPLSPRPVLEVRRGRAYVAESLTPVIRVMTPEGMLEQQIAWQPDTRLTAEDAARLVVDSAVRTTDASRAAGLRRHLEAAPIREHLSVFWKFIVDDEGFIWIRSFEPLKHAAALGGLSLPGGGLGGTWLILAPDGVVAGAVDVPADLEVVRVTSDAVVGIARDELGVESVRVHRLERR